MYVSLCRPLVSKKCPLSMLPVRANESKTCSFVNFKVFLPHILVD